MFSRRTFATLLACIPLFNRTAAAKPESVAVATKPLTFGGGYQFDGTYLTISILPVERPTVSGRIYSRSVLEAALSRLDMAAVIPNAGWAGGNTAYVPAGNLWVFVPEGTPDTPRSVRSVVGGVQSLWFTDSDLMARIRITSGLPLGEALSAACRNKVPLTAGAYGEGVVSFETEHDKLVGACRVTHFNLLGVEIIEAST